MVCFSAADFSFSLSHQCSPLNHCFFDTYSDQNNFKRNHHHLKHTLPWLKGYVVKDWCEFCLLFIGDQYWFMYRQQNLSKDQALNTQLCYTTLYNFIVAEYYHTQTYYIRSKIFMNSFFFFLIHRCMHVTNAMKHCCFVFLESQPDIWSSACI